jgi:hypothetical protein
MRIGIGCAAMVVLWSGWSSLAGAADVSFAADYGEPRVIIAAPEDPSLAHVAWPKVVRTADGTLVVAAIAGEFHGTHGGGCPVTAYSTDGGATFSPLQVLKRYGPGLEYTSAGNCALGVAEDGAVVLLSMAYNADVASTIDGWRSTDSGRTWTPVDVSTLDRNQTGSVYGHVNLVPGQGLAVFGHYRKPANVENGGLWLAWSRDKGRTWEAPQPVQLETTQRLVEPAVLHSGGRFIGLIRNSQDHYLQITSDDLGATWAKPTPVLKPEDVRPATLPSPCLVNDPEHPGRLLALVSERHGKDNASGLLGRLTLWEATDSELQWKKLGDVARFPQALRARTDITYGWMTPLGAGKWYVVFYCGKTRGASDIYGMTIDVN